MTGRMSPGITDGSHEQSGMRTQIVLDSIGGLTPGIPETLRLVARRGFEGFILRAYELEARR